MLNKILIIIFLLGIGYVDVTAQGRGISASHLLTQPSAQIPERSKRLTSLRVQTTASRQISVITSLKTPKYLLRYINQNLDAKKYK